MTQQINEIGNFKCVQINMKHLCTYGCFWYLLHGGARKVQTRLHKRAASSEPSFLTYTKCSSRGRLRLRFSRYLLRNSQKSFKSLKTFKRLRKRIHPYVLLLDKKNPPTDPEPVTIQNGWNNRISYGCVYAQIRSGLGMHLGTYSNHDTVLFLLIVPIKGRFV